MGTRHERGRPVATDRLRVVGALALALACGGCAELIPAAPAAPAPGAAAPARHATMEQQVHAQINRHRASRSMAPLAYDERLAEIARRHSEAMAGGRRAFSHEGFDARAAEVRRFLEMGSMAENIASNDYPDPGDQAVRGWLNSPGHLRNIEGSFDVTGVGIARAPDGTYYFTQLFVKRR